MSQPPLRLDFCRPAMQRPGWLAWLLLAAALAAMAAVVNEQAQADDTVATLQQHHERLQARLHNKPRSAKGTERLDAAAARRIQQANTAIDQMTIPWDGLFRTVEAADAREIGLLALVPNAQDRSLRLSGEARRIDDVLAYVDRLSTQAGLQGVHLLAYDTAEREGLAIVSFTLAAQWQAE